MQQSEQLGQAPSKAHRGIDKNVELFVGRYPVCRNMVLGLTQSPSQ